MSVDDDSAAAYASENWILEESVMVLTRRAVFFAAILLGCAPVFAATFTVSTNTNWSAIAGGPPGTADTVVISGSATLTVDVGNAACGTLQINSATVPGSVSVLAFKDGSSALAVVGNCFFGGIGAGSGSINMSQGGTLSCGLLADGMGNGFTPGTGTVVITGSGALPPTPSFNTFNNLTISGTGRVLSLGQNTTVMNALTVAAGDLNLDTFALKAGTLAGAGNLNLGSMGLTLDGSGSTAFSGVIAGSPSGGFNYSGTGTLTLSGNNTYLGFTQINSGILTIQGDHSLGNGQVMTNAGTLAGSGKLNATDISNSANLSPGTPGGATGILTSDVFFQPNGAMIPTLNVRLNGTTPGTGHDQITTSGAGHIIDLNGANLKLALGTGTKGGDAFTIVSATNGALLQKAFAGLAEGATFSAGGVGFKISYVNNAVVVTQTQTATLTTVESSVNPSSAGQPVTFTATVSNATKGSTVPTGSVVFRVDGVATATVPLVTGATATFTASALTTGNHTVVASYVGDANSAPSDSAPLTQSVLAATQSAAIFAAATGPGTTGHVKVFDGATGQLKFSFFPFPGFTGGVNVAVGDVNGDATPDILCAAGPGGNGHVKVFDGKSLALLHSFFAFTGFNGGVNVTAGDINGDGFMDVVAAPDAGGGPNVKAFSGKDGSLLSSFFAYAPAFTGGVFVAAGDVDGDGRTDIVTGTGSGAQAHVKVFSGATGAEIRSFFAFDAGFTGGVTVAAGDVNGDGFADVITGTGGGATEVRVFDGLTISRVNAFFAFGGFAGGVRVASADVNGDGRADIIVGAGPSGAPQVKIFGANLATLSDFTAFDMNFRGGVQVAGGGGPNLPLKFTSGPTATPNPATVGETIAFAATTIGAPTFTWDFGDGTTGAGPTVTHLYRVAGTYNATVKASDLGGRTASSSVIVTVNAATIGTAVLAGEIDSDGDGMSDTVEKAYGSDPNNPDSKPGDASPEAKRLTQVKFTIAGRPKDGGPAKKPVKLTITGTLDLPADFKTDGKIVVADIAGYTKKFTLDAKGKSRKPNKTDKDTFALAVKAKKGIVPAQMAKFQLVLNGVPETVKEGVPYQIVIGNHVFTK